MPSVACVAGLAGGGEVGVDVGAPEGVDGLLGIADQHQGGAALAEGHAHDVPLDRIGVLELVDQGHAVVLRSRSHAAGPRVSSLRVWRSRVSRSS